MGRKRAQGKNLITALIDLGLTIMMDSIEAKLIGVEEAAPARYITGKVKAKEFHVSPGVTYIPPKNKKQSQRKAR